MYIINLTFMNEYKHTLNEAIKVNSAIRFIQYTILIYELISISKHNN